MGSKREILRRPACARDVSHGSIFRVSHSKVKKKSFFSVIFMIELFLFNKLAGPFNKKNYVKSNRDLQNSSPSYFKSSGVCWKQ